MAGPRQGHQVITELAGDPGVAHSVYVSAFWPARGQTLMDLVDPDGLAAILARIPA